MDLTTMEKNLKKKVYDTPAKFAADFRLIVKNAQTFNRQGEPVHGFASELSAMFEKKFGVVEETLRKQTEERHREKARRKAEKKLRRKKAKSSKKSGPMLTVGTP